MEMRVTPEVRTQLDQGLWLPLMEEFPTLQGEGAHTGSAAWFIRVGGCDVGCHWCDVKESWNPDLHPVTDVKQIAAHARDKAPVVVVTGGEPLAWNMEPLTTALRANGQKIHLETSGAYPLSGTWDWICLSPKKTAPPREEVLAAANELKVIVYNRHDLLWAEEHAKKVSPSCRLFLQPEWSKREEILPGLTDYILANPQWSLSLQTHKYIGLP